MNFNDVIKIVQNRLENETLPGEAAHYQMAPDERPGLATDSANANIGSVLLLVYPRRETPHLLLIQRTEYQGVHSGQVSFPGGKMEARDKDLSETALRETEEETGWPAKAVSVLGEISRLYIPPSNFMVYPIVGFSLDLWQFRLERQEVEHIIEVPLALLFENHIRKRGLIRLSNGNSVDCPYYDLKGHVVWGATAMMLNEFISLLSNPYPIKP